MVLVDTSVWIDYFAGKEKAQKLNTLIDTNNICINDLILVELIPSIDHAKEFELKELLYSIRRLEINIDWNQLIKLQIMNLKNGINKVGIPDLIIAQNAIENDIELFSLDKHFELMSNISQLKLFI
jgi:predicted nucleic acid-binding protein